MTDLIKQWDEYIESMGSVMGAVEHMAQQMRDRIEELEKERDAALAAQPYTYIGKDMKPILARDLEDAKDAAEAKLAQLAIDTRIFHLNAEALSEIKAVVDGQSEQSIKAIIYDLLAELEGK